MSGHSTAERRVRDRRSASLPTMGLSLEELILLLEIAPRGWTAEEASGLVRRIAREICSKSVAPGQFPAPQTTRWRRLSQASDEEIQLTLVPDSASSDGVGDRILSAAVTLLKHDLAALKGT